MSIDILIKFLLWELSETNDDPFIIRLPLASQFAIIFTENHIH